MAAELGAQLLEFENADLSRALDALATPVIDGAADPVNT